MKFYTAFQFAIFRIIFGIYLTWHFATLISYSTELFGCSGMIPSITMNPTSEVWGLFIKDSVLLRSDVFASFSLCILTIAAILFTLGVYRNYCSFVLWCGWIYLFNRNNLIANPGIPYVGWLLLVCIIIPSGEGFSLTGLRNPVKEKEWYMPSYIYYGAWFLMALGYSISGLDKLRSPSWVDGSAMNHVLSCMLARDYWLTHIFLSTPPIMLKMMTWGSLAAELLFLPLGVFDRMQKWFWLLFMGFHLGILLLVNFTDLTLGVLMIHIFTFDSRWLNSLLGLVRVKSN